MTTLGPSMCIFVFKVKSHAVLSGLRLISSLRMILNSPVLLFLPLKRWDCRLLSHTCLVFFLRQSNYTAQAGLGLKSLAS